MGSVVIILHGNLFRQDDHCTLGCEALGVGRLKQAVVKGLNLDN